MPTFKKSSYRKGITMGNITISVTGRNGVVIPEHFKDRIDEKLERATKYDPTITHIDILLKSYKNPKRSDADSQVEITATGTGHTSRAESTSDNFYAALDDAIEKLEGTLRKVKTQRKITKGGHRAPASIGETSKKLLEELKQESAEQKDDPYEDQVEFYEPGHIVRTKEVQKEPITPDEALSRMELVGHDFYLFHNVETDKPSLVYRRHGFDYGLITLV